ncbi:MAG: redoxin domain-containing protein [Gemmatimonadetes bacterium]|nr:redoxin domain-containing protein [Gemmatimonadota bacterium]
MNWQRALVAASVAVPVLVLLRIGLELDPRAIPSPLPGRPAPGFALATLEDDVGGAVGREGAGAPASGRAPDTVRLSTLRGDVVVLNFWASWCLACRDEHEPLSATARAYADESVRFFGVLYNDTPDNARRWIRAMGGQSYPTLLDPDARTAIEYGLYGVPETFFIARDGRVAYKHVGPVTEALLVERIETLLVAPQPPGGP